MFVYSARQSGCELLHCFKSQSALVSAFHKIQSRDLSFINSTKSGLLASLTWFEEITGERKLDTSAALQLGDHIG